MCKCYMFLKGNYVALPSHNGPCPDVSIFFHPYLCSEESHQDAPSFWPVHVRLGLAS